MMSPDQHWIVLWNPSTPQEAGTIGWMIVALDTTNIMYRIEDPVDWGATLTPDNEPGGFTGQPLFLEDGRLVGTISHQSLCSEFDCKYDLNVFNFETHEFEPFHIFSDDKFSQGISLSLENKNTMISNFGTQYSSCEIFSTLLKCPRLEFIRSIKLAFRRGGFHGCRISSFDGSGDNCSYFGMQRHRGRFLVCKMRVNPR